MCRRCPPRRRCSPDEGRNQTSSEEPSDAIRLEFEAIERHLMRDAIRRHQRSHQTQSGSLLEGDAHLDATLGRADETRRLRCDEQLRRSACILAAHELLLTARVRELEDDAIRRVEAATPERHVVATAERAARGHDRYERSGHED